MSIMQFVEPIRDLKKISQIKNMLRGAGNIRDLLLFELGINSALRISDLLSIKVGDVFKEGGEPKDRFRIRESKTSKLQQITITPKVRKTLIDYSTKYPGIVAEQENYLFFNTKARVKGKEHIGRKQGWLMIAKRCKDVGLNGNYGGHTLRKTWGYQGRKQGVSIEIIQDKLNHSSLSITKRYLGITAAEIEEACLKLDL